MLHHYFVRVGNGKAFENSIDVKTWCLDSKSNMGKSFIKTVKSCNPESDKIILWIVKKEQKGIPSYVATFDKLIPRETGPLISVTPTSEEYGWGPAGDSFDTAVAYTHLVDIRAAPVETGCIGRSSWQRITNAPEDLDNVYRNIIRFHKCNSVENGFGQLNK